MGDAVGDSSWRAWAGRSSSDDFLLGDLFRGLYKSARWHLRSAPMAPCPICYDDISGNPDGWHKLWCGCHVCVTCCAQWAQQALQTVAPQTDGSERSVTLTCPACSAPLRACDASKILERNDGLRGAVDMALRDALLRGMRDFRPCPSASCTGGGFVTWDCIGRGRRLSRWWALGLSAGGPFIFFCFGGDSIFTVETMADAGQTWVLVCVAVVAQAYAMATFVAARAASADSPLRVQCPECSCDFALPAPDAAADAAAAGASSSPGGLSDADGAWIREHTRPCPRPSCRAPILKTGGCNAMRCARCRLQFCWACMQPLRRCTHFECANGAPHGNASLWSQLQAVDGDRVAAAGERVAWLARGVALAAELVAMGVTIVLALGIIAGLDHALAFARLMGEAYGVVLLLGSEVFHAVWQGSLYLLRTLILTMAGALLLSGLTPLLRAPGRDVAIYIEGWAAEVERIFRAWGLQHR